MEKLFQKYSKFRRVKRLIFNLFITFFVSKKRPEAGKVNKNVLELNQMLDNL